MYKHVHGNPACLIAIEPIVEGDMGVAKLVT